MRIPHQRRNRHVAWNDQIENQESELRMHALLSSCALMIMILRAPELQDLLFMKTLISVSFWSAVRMTGGRANRQNHIDHSPNDIDSLKYFQTRSMENI